MSVFYWLNAIMSMMLTYRMGKIFFIQSSQSKYILGLTYACLFMVPVLLLQATQTENVVMMVIIWSIAWPVSYLTQSIKYDWKESEIDNVSYIGFIMVSGLIILSANKWSDVLAYWIATSIFVSLMQSIKRYDTYKRPFIREFMLNTFTLAFAPILFPLGLMGENKAC